MTQQNRGQARSRSMEQRDKPPLPGATNYIHAGSRK